MKFRLLENTQHSYDSLDEIKEDLELSNEYDSEGNQLTKAQAQFFKNSKVRDSKGRLLVCYHGTNNEFDEFKKEKALQNFSVFGNGFYFLDNEEGTKEYGNKAKRCYLNMTNPLSWKNEKFGDYIDKYHKEYFDNHKLIDIASEIEKEGYDGLIWKSDTYIVFEPNQIKSITNKNPTSSDNINERLKVDKMKLAPEQDRRRKLTDEQKEQIKDLYKTGEYSLNQLAQEYGVSKKLILLIVNPESKAKNDARIKAHWQDYYDREEHNKAIKNLRDYKKDLLAKGELQETLLYHRSNNIFDEFDASRVGTNQGRARNIQGYWFFDFDDKSKTHGEHLYQANVDTSNFYRTNSKKKLLNKDNIKAFFKKNIYHIC